MKKLYKLLGIIAIGTVIGLTVFGCKKDADDDDDPPAPPPELPSTATKQDAEDTLNAIITHPGVSAEIKGQAEAWLASLDDDWASSSSEVIANINDLIQEMSGGGDGAKGEPKPSP